MRLTKLLSGAAVAALGTGLAWSAPVVAQDIEADEVSSEDERQPIIPIGRAPILVTASRDAGVAARYFTGSATIVTPEQIEQRQIRDIADVLRDVPGVAVSSVAGQTQLRLRGGEANHVLVLVDGIEVSDPGSGEFDIGTLQAEIGSRLEVIRGPQSALYGNDAVTGVIAYESASGRAREGFDAFLEGGTNNTINGSARTGFNGSGWDAALSATVVSTDGEPNARGGTRDIGRDSYTVSGKGSVRLAENFTLRGAGRYTLNEGQFNNQAGGLVVDSPGTRFENESVSALIGARLEVLEGSWVHDLSAQITDADRQTDAPTGFPSSTESDRFKASYVTSYAFGGRDHRLTFAADYELEGFNNVLTFDDRNEVENVGFVGEYRYDGDGFNFSASVRHDINDLFEDATTFRAGAGYSITDTTRLRAAVGSGVKNPTLSELFGFFDGVFVGNPDLQPEKSTSWEVGVAQSIADGAVTLSVTYFNAELENEIFVTFPAPAFVQTPGNRVTDSAQQGVEVALAARLGGGFTFNGAYSFLDAEEAGVEEIRRPDHIASAVLDWASSDDRAGVNLAVRYNGDATDNNFGTFPATVETVQAFTLVNLNARYQLAEGLEVFARAENLLDEDYEQVFSFVAPGRQVLAGFSARF
ncbi:MAG: TonB-dependent receptor [Erythrobacter sp.]